MKRLILCFDGTWNTLTNPKELTNIVKICNTVSATASDGIPQICYYNSGVGSGGPIDRFAGGVFGAGLRSNVQRGLSFLALNYREDDEIYLFGFSRGAYTARALAGVLGVVGIPYDISKAGEHWDYYRRIAKLESDNRGRDKKSQRYKNNRRQIRKLRDELLAKPEPPKDPISLFHPSQIKLAGIGVFDTVGAYGVPFGIGLSAIGHLFTYWTRGFHSREIGKVPRVALHAMAIDEMRRPFYPTFWMESVKRKPRQQNDIDDRDADEKVLADREDPYVEQAWFAGVHCNIGGSYVSCGLSDIALAWMISRVEDLTPLEFDESELLKEIWPCSASTLYNSSWGRPLTRVRSILPPPSSETLIARFLRALKRPFSRRGRFARPRLNEHVHWSVEERRQLDKALVDKVGLRKYEPRNLPRNGCKTYLQKTELEKLLTNTHREGWMSHCPFGQEREKCLCAARQDAAGAQPDRRPAAA